jgi:hypothetical protein
MRLQAQRLMGEPFASAVEAVRWFGAVQSQDYAAAKWGVGQRVAGATEAILDAAFDAGALLRTHVMRPTWHFVLPEDIRWLQELTSARVLAGLAGRHRQLELDQHTIARAADLFATALADQHALTRADLGEVLLSAGISPHGQRLPHLLAAAEHACVITSGPRRGNQHTYSLVRDRAPAARSLAREEALAELSTRYFRSHGPAQLRDFAWWSGLKIGDIRLGIELAGRSLEHGTAGGADYWWAAEALDGGRQARVAHLLPNFDEFTVGYRDRSALIDRNVRFDPRLFAYFRGSAPQAGILSNVVTIDGRVRGAWTRELSGARTVVNLMLLADLDPAELAAVSSAASKLARFLHREVQVRGL